MTSIQQHSKAERPKEQLKKQKSTSSRDSESSDCSYDFVQDLNPKSSLKRTPEEEQELLSKYKGKHGLKYQKISNELRQKLIKQVTTTGCTIKSAARELNINFSTAKAIMQIYRKEGRTSKKIKRTKTLEELKNPDSIIKRGLMLAKTKYCIGQYRDNSSSTSGGEQQKSSHINIINKCLGQNLNKFKNQYLQERVNQLQQEKSQLCQNYSYLTFQYNQLQQMVLKIKQIDRSGKPCHHIKSHINFDYY